MSLQEILTAAPDCSQTPNEVRSLVLDYLLHSCYCESATAFVQDVSVAEVNQPALDTLWEDGPATEQGALTRRDGLKWDNRVLDDARLRQTIQDYILRGDIAKAIAECEAHFPSVLSTPLPLKEKDGDSFMTSSISSTNSLPKRTYPLFSTSNLLPRESEPSYKSDPRIVRQAFNTPADSRVLILDLRIQLFIENLQRNAAITSEEDADMDEKRTASGSSSSSSHSAQFSSVLAQAQSLYSYLHSLKSGPIKEHYLKELQAASGLMAYPDLGMVGDTLKEYLDPARRQDLAQRMNRAILESCGFRPTPVLQQIAEQTGAVFKSLEGLKASIPAKNGRGEKSKVQAIGLRELLDSGSGVEGGMDVE